MKLIEKFNDKYHVVYEEGDLPDTFIGWIWYWIKVLLTTGCILACLAIGIFILSKIFC